MEEIKALISEIAPHIQCTKSSAKNKYRVDYTQLTDAVTNKWRYWMRNDFLDQDEIYSRILSNEYIDELANTIALRKPMHNTNKYTKEKGEKPSKRETIHKKGSDFEADISKQTKQSNSSTDDKQSASDNNIVTRVTNQEASEVYDDHEKKAAMIHDQARDEKMSKSLKREKREMDESDSDIDSYDDDSVDSDDSDDDIPIQLRLQNQNKQRLETMEVKTNTDFYDADVNNDGCDLIHAEKFSKKVWHILRNNRDCVLRTIKFMYLIPKAETSMHLNATLITVYNSLLSESDRKTYQRKVRDLLFNLNHNATLKDMAMNIKNHSIIAKMDNHELGQTEWTSMN
eukprot:58677_1